MTMKLKPPGNSLGAHIRSNLLRNNEPSQIKKPLFSFQYLDSEYCISCCTKDEKAALADTLRKLSALTWAQINQAPRHGMGCEKIEKTAIKTSIPTVIKEDSTILAFRFCGKAPMVGFRDNETFHVIWLDRNFKLYNHG